MEEKEILKELMVLYPILVSPIDKFPKAYKGTKKIKAIILGADPTHIVDDNPKQLDVVFKIDDPKSPYWKGIKKNVDIITCITQENIYVQNLCRNYFTVETSKNNEWVGIARRFWIPLLKKELDFMFDKSIPILMTTEFILKAAMKEGEKIIKAKLIYNDSVVIEPEKNLFGRELIAFYRHFKYSLTNHENYRLFIDKRLDLA